MRCGKIIRSLKLDEFPQLINVMRGDLNLIGPRPGLISQTELEKVRVIDGIYNTKPGITGLAQVLGYDMSNPETLTEVDKLYIENKTLILIVLQKKSLPKKVNKLDNHQYSGIFESFYNLFSNSSTTQNNNQPLHNTNSNTVIFRNSYIYIGPIVVP